MNIYDAAKVLGLNGVLDPALIKSAYRVACKRYHPDVGGSLHMMQAVNEAYECLASFTGTIGISQKEAEFGDSLNAAIQAILHFEDLEIEVCGSWLWVGGITKPIASVLKEAGFKFSANKEKWYFSPPWERKRSFRKKAWEMEDIRSSYGSRKVPGQPRTKMN